MTAPVSPALPAVTLAGLDYQVLALRVGLDLVRRVGTAAALVVTVDPEIVSGSRPKVNLQVVEGSAVCGVDSVAEDRARLAGIRTVAAILGGRLALADRDDHTRVGVTGISAVDLDGVEVDIWTHLRNDTVRAEARALLTTADGGVR